MCLKTVIGVSTGMLSVKAKVLGQMLVLNLWLG